ncbi:hypothetical protein BT96DRAFT_939127 [Gymnopus androsaceus JB14]|uniref:Uncharacterized protein n=1 Tax=Gymnopus androsaceus JB14 TaxID=1447944 RepID=A0A6A4HPY9_9AGAR|nr:hypothetical protein BT96DRAFT_939127 [Gymnopus androsaceus JB14]
MYMQFHAKHWSSTINLKRLVVRDLVLERFHELFSLEPSLPLYIAMLDLSEEPDSTTDELMEVFSTIATSSSSNFAAALVAPPGLGDDDDGDTMGYLEDPDDPDLEDLREELRPRLKERFLGWEAVAVATKGGANVLAKVHNKMLEDMPFLLRSDVTDAMILRFTDRPSKEHIIDSLEEL